MRTMVVQNSDQMIVYTDKGNDMTQTAEIGAELARGRLNDEMLDRMRSLIGHGVAD